MASIDDENTFRQDSLSKQARSNFEPDPQTCHFGRSLSTSSSPWQSNIDIHYTSIHPNSETNNHPVSIEEEVSSSLSPTYLNPNTTTAAPAPPLQSVKNWSSFWHRHFTTLFHHILRMRFILIAFIALIFFVNFFGHYYGQVVSHHSGLSTEGQQHDYLHNLQALSDNYLLDHKLQGVEPSRYEHGAVATETYSCSLIGKDILQQGGNAVDAAIAANICVGVIDNFSAGIGGGGFMLIRLPNGTSEAYDFRETAPFSSTSDMFEENPEDAILGGRSIAIPGELRGYELVHKKYGQLPWKDLFSPSIHLARRGFLVTPELARRLSKFSSEILRNPTLNETYSFNGKILTEGDVCRRENLANTLEVIADAGSADPFYSGEIADSLINFINSYRGDDSKNLIVTSEDFSKYSVLMRPVLETFYHGMKILSISAPASGAVLLEALNILEGFRPTDPMMEGSLPSALDMHRFVEVCKHVYSAKSQLADPMYDPELIKSFENAMLDKNQAMKIRQTISDDRTYTPDYYYPPDWAPPSDHGTTHTSALDETGMAVSVMSTVNLVFGSRLMDPHTGVLLNDQMSDFALSIAKSHKRAGDPWFDMPPSPRNKPAPNKRPFSSGVPCIVLDSLDRVKLVIGAAGGTRIPTATLQVIWLLFNYKLSLKQAMNFPRLHHQLIPNKIYAEYLLPNYYQNSLKKRGHVLEITKKGKFESSVQAVLKHYGSPSSDDSDTAGEDYLEAMSDYRKGGLASGY